MHEHRADVESDFSAIHHITDPESLTPQRFIDYAVRLGHYPGAVRAVLEGEAVVGGADVVAGSDRHIDSSPEALQGDPVLAEFVDFG